MAFRNPIIGSNDELVRNKIRSENYVAGVSGWQISRDGDAEFNDVTVRGELVARNGDAFIGLFPAQPNLSFNPDDDVYVDGSLAFVDLAGAGVETTLKGPRLLAQGVPTLHWFSDAQPNGSFTVQASTTEVQGDLDVTGDLSVDGIGQVRFFRKSAAQNRQSSTLIDATDMVFAAAAGAIYEVRLRVAYDALTTDDFKMAWTIPSGCDLDRSILAPSPGGGITDNQNVTMATIWRSATTAQVASGTGGVTNAFTAWWEDIICDNTAGVAGNVQLQFARNAGAGIATMQAGSYMIVTRVA